MPHSQARVPPSIRVACGVLRRADGQVLLAQRPEGKIAAGQWEFPGGKIEPGESARLALARELHEELGVTLSAARPLIRFTHEYSDRTVSLETWLVSAWDGVPQGRENQRFVWRAPSAPGPLDLLPTVAPILRALQLPSHYVFTPPQLDERRLLAGLAALPPGALLRLRLPRLDDAAYERLACTVMKAAGSLRVVLDRCPRRAAMLGAAGWHATDAALRRGHHPVIPGLLRLASCHDAGTLALAREQGFDAAVLGPVSDTPSHPGAATLGWVGFGELAARATLPLYAIGGLGPAQLDEAFAAYAQGVAGISAYWSRSGS